MKNEIKQALKRHGQSATHDIVLTIRAKSIPWLRWQNERIEELEKALERAKEEMRWGVSASAIERAPAIINKALGKEQPK